ncbi:hypothetical protein [Streptomyces mirabilis]|uniref:hypothetical protein n=1 Tax=Streptomyces mirabilis TaxID=68239 RepID=UPI003655933E
MLDQADAHVTPESLESDGRGRCRGVVRQAREDLVDVRFEQGAGDLVDRVLAGWYRTIAYVANGARIEPEPWALALPGTDRSGA